MYSCYTNLHGLRMILDKWPPTRLPFPQPSSMFPRRVSRPTISPVPLETFCPNPSCLTGKTYLGQWQMRSNYLKAVLLQEDGFQKVLAWFIFCSYTAFQAAPQHLVHAGHCGWKQSSNQTHKLHTSMQDLMFPQWVKALGTQKSMNMWNKNKNSPLCTYQEGCGVKSKNKHLGR